VVHEKVKGVCLTPAEIEAHDIKLGDHDVGISETSIPDGKSDRWDGCTDCLYLEFQVNTWTTDDQAGPSVTSLSNGGFVVVWSSGCDYGGCTPQDGSGLGLYGQRFDPNGNRVGSEFQVNTWTTGDQRDPSITSLSNGGFVVVWQSNGQDGPSDGVYGQRFDSNGNKVGSEFQVNTWTTSTQWLPSITSLSNGGFVVVWQSYGQDGSVYGVYGRIFSQ
jgi:methionine-rich copper-binding protein CopC